MALFCARTAPKTPKNAITTTPPLRRNTSLLTNRSRQLAP
jgi:hypothetical protein